MVGEQRFSDMRQEYNMLNREHEEALKKAARYQEDLKEANERVKGRDSSIFQLEKEKKLMHTVLDKARDDLEKAYEAACQLDLSLFMVV